VLSRIEKQFLLPKIELIKDLIYLMELDE